MQCDYSPVMVLDDKILFKELLEQYKGLPCLWDQTHELYNNKSVRQQGYEQLLKTYRRGEPTASLNDLKRKLDNMRACYKRERAKVFKARMNGDVHVPMLWYYNLYRFLDEDVDNGHTPSANRRRKIVSVLKKNEEETGEEERCQEEILEEERYDEVEMLEEYEVDYLKSEEANPLSSSKKNILYMTDSFQNQSQTYETGKECTDSYANLETSMDAFGKTVGLQLKELQPLQRYIAEKLISDVIFHGRMGELNRETVLDLKNCDGSSGE